MRNETKNYHFQLLANRIRLLQRGKAFIFSFILSAFNFTSTYNLQEVSSSHLVI
jgi:hypothetical protein